MRTHGFVICGLLIAWLVIAPSPASAGVALYDWAFNVNGTVYVSPGPYSAPVPGSLPVFFNTSAFNWSTGLGTITIDYRPGAGSYFFVVFVDHEIDNDTNGAYNEFASDPSGTLGPGQTWEVDEPGWNMDPAFPMGDIYGHATGATNALDNANGLPFTNPYNVSMALGWNINIPDAGQRAVITLDLNTAGLPASGFWLEQHDLDSPDVVYMSGNSQINTIPVGAIPEPGTILLVAAGVAAAALRSVLKRR